MSADEMCICGRDDKKGVGSTVSIGDTVGHGIECYSRYARVVGFLHNTKRMPVILRKFKTDDKRWPTGEYRRTGLPYPWFHDHPTQDPGPSLYVSGDRS